MPELPLEERQRDYLTRLLDGMGTGELMRREPAADSGGLGGVG